MRPYPSGIDHASIIPLGERVARLKRGAHAQSNRLLRAEHTARRLRLVFLLTLLLLTLLTHLLLLLCVLCLLCLRRLRRLFLRLLRNSCRPGRPGRAGRRPPSGAPSRAHPLRRTERRREHRPLSRAVLPQPPRVESNPHVVPLMPSMEMNLRLALHTQPTQVDHLGPVPPTLLIARLYPIAQAHSIPKHGVGRCRRSGGGSGGFLC